ncbi:WD repeat-containing and planar cell polarity effector protein fritz homolog isoform X3 [Dreissena polymorpha]|uniref:WD repeat-containing and planar cell polarity effector protein fritz homolog isoform X3 n=1 Tax=Dreissena polymorpha TaxID=45954 RepID=UPI002264B3A7|nr:WD repeat-containing and planar cell polarity effector protein fritz homolog isoform X3 [Dreissena polymorpha]
MKSLKKVMCQPFLKTLGAKIMFICNLPISKCKRSMPSSITSCMLPLSNYHPKHPMASCLTELFLWTLKENVSIPNDVIGCHSYHDKSDPASDQPYNEEKKQFTEGRDMIWAPKNKRPEKLRDNIKDMEELLSAFKTVHTRWRSRKMLQILLSNACVVNIVLSDHSGDIERLLIDKSLVGKLSADTVTDAVLTDQFFVSTYGDKSRLDYVFFCKRPPLGEAIKRLEKLSSWDPKVTSIDIPGPVGRRLERHVCVNKQEDMVLVWWSSTSKEAMPWSPMATDRDRANIIAVSCHGPNIDVLTFARTECDPVSVHFSQFQQYKFFTIEQGMGSGGETTAKACTYDIIQNKIQRLSAISIPLKSMVLCECHSPGEDKLVLGCADGTLVIYDENKKKTELNKAAVIPSVIAWHPTGTIFFVAGGRGDVQVFDIALTPLKIQLLDEEPCPTKILQMGKYFRSAPALRDMKWCEFDPLAADWHGDYVDALAVVFDKGPVGLLQMSLGLVSRERFSCVELVREYIRAKQVDEAVSLLCSMSWDQDGTSCYTCLTTIVTHLLKMPLNAEREVNLQTALGTFYSPKQPLSESTILDYRDPISRLARRFFHHLLRYARFDKAYLLAVDIGAKDLFMDIHFMALDKGETALAEVSRRKAEQVDSESIESYNDTLPGLDGGGFYQQHNGVANNHSNRHREEIPVSRQHPWQQSSSTQGHLSHDSSLQSHNASFQSQRSMPSHDAPLAGAEHSGRGASRRRVQYSDQQLSNDLDAMNMHSDLISDYTAALNDGGGAWASSVGSTAANNGSDEKGVKVFRFGVV